MVESVDTQTPRTPRIDLPQAQVAAFCAKWGVVEFALFGSVMRDDFGPESDVDVMVRFETGRIVRMSDFENMRRELESLFGREVDLMERHWIENPYRRRSINRDLTVVYAA